MSLLKHRIEMLRLREDAPFPSECEIAQQMIREWRHANLVRRLDCSDGDSDPDYLDVDTYIGEQE